MTCPHAHLDASYVLGSLSPSERQEFERHLSTCDECSQAVRELAGLPGLLSRVDRSVLEFEPADEPVPDTILPALVAEVRRRRKRGLVVAAGAVAAAAVVAVGVPLVLAYNGDDGRTQASPSSSQSAGPTPVAEAMTTVGGAPVTGALAFESVAWGTRLDLTCTYPKAGHGTDGGYGGPGNPTRYEMVVRTTDGHVDQVGTWKAVEGATMNLTAATAATRDQISRVVVRTSNGLPVLRLDG